MDRSTVPVLAPAAVPLLERAIVISKPTWYALSVSQDGLAIALRATRLAYRYPNVAPRQGDRRVRGQPAFVSQERRIYRASWLQHGAAYTIEVECSSPDDSRCADETFLLELADELVFVGGRRDGSAQAVGEAEP